ncbi:MAG: hypothetical protein K0M56_05695 [Kaistella sp.]|nr:hypothetical protein [Kaistella sp.]
MIDLRTYFKSMKKLILFLGIFMYQFYASQEDLKIEIVNDTIKKVSYYDQCNIVYTVTNNGDRSISFLLDSKEFNEDPEYTVEPFFVGLPDYYIYEKNKRLDPGFSFGANLNTFMDINILSDEYEKFEEKYSKLFDENDLRVAYRISKNIIHLKPKETKVFKTRVNFPGYRSRYYALVNKGKYYFQMSLNNPAEIILKYSEIISSDNVRIYTGQIYSNKVPLVYEVYNNE